MNSNTRMRNTIYMVTSKVRYVLPAGAMFFIGFAFLSVFTSYVYAATYNYTPSDNMAEIRDCIEGKAGGCQGSTLAAGDTVNLTPGTYAFGAIMTVGGTSSAHITIQGTSTTNPAIIDLTDYEMYDSSVDRLPVGSPTWGAGTGTVSAHGTSTGRISWRIAVLGVSNAGWIDFLNIEIKGAHTWNGVNNAWDFWIKDGSEITMTNCKATNCQEGLWYRTDDYGDINVSDGTEKVILRNCAFTNCGLDPLQASYSSQYPYPQHPLYVEGGSLDMRFCELSARKGSGATFINNRAVTSDIRYSYFHNNSNDAIIQNSNPLNQQDTEFEQVHTYVGNLFVLNNPDSASWTGAWYSIQEGGGSSGRRTQPIKQTVRFYYNTVIAADTYNFMGSQRYWFKAERSGSMATHDPTITSYNNLFYNPNSTAGQIMMPYVLNHGSSDVGTITVDMDNNLITGTSTNIDPTHGTCDILINGCRFFTNPIYGSGADPFKNRGAGDYSLAETGTARDGADSTIGILPQYEYAHPSSGRPRTNLNDLGAIQYISGTPLPPHNLRIIN